MDLRTVGIGAIQEAFTKKILLVQYCSIMD